MTTPTTLDTRTTRSRPAVGLPELGTAAAAGVICYGIGILLLTMIPAGHSILAGLAQYAVSGLAPLGAFAAAVLVRSRDVRAFGLRRVEPKWLLIAGGAGIGAIVLNLVLTAVVVSAFSLPTDVQSDYRSAATGGLASFAGALLLGAILTPIGEEVLFRGVLANALARFGPWVAVPVSAAVFALAHGINYIMVVAFMIGIVNALLLRRTGSIWPGVIVHALNNANAVILPMILS